MTQFDYVRNCWYPIGFSREFPEGDLQGHKVADKPIVMWRGDDGKVVGFDDRCCHKRLPLSQSKLLDQKDRLPAPRQMVRGRCAHRPGADDHMLCLNLFHFV